MEAQRGVVLDGLARAIGRSDRDRTVSIGIGGCTDADAVAFADDLARRVSVDAFELVAGAVDRDDPDVVVELREPMRPVVRAASGLARQARTSDPAVREERAFFAPRAEHWNERFREDAPAFEVAVEMLGLERGDTVADVGCGAGRAFEPLAEAVGASGLVVGLDVTPEMLDAARAHAGAPVSLLLADAGHLPLSTGSCDALLGAGLLGHLPNDLLALVELARVARAGGRLALFHPAGRQRHDHAHGREHRAHDRRAERNVEALLAASGWEVGSIDDRPDRYLAIATRPASEPAPPPSSG